MDKKQHINGDSTVKRYDEGGQRVTSCCGCYSTYMDDGTGGDMVLCCKACYNEVEIGEGDGSEFLTAIDIDLYYKTKFAAEEVEAEKRAYAWKSSTTRLW